MRGLPRILPWGERKAGRERRSGINVSNSRIEALACARVAYVATSCRFRTTGRPVSLSLFFSLFSSPVFLLARSLLPLRSLFLTRSSFSQERRVRRAIVPPRNAEPNLEKRTGAPDISCAHANYSSTMQRVHMVVHHYPHDTSSPSRKQTLRVLSRSLNLPGLSPARTRTAVFRPKTADLSTVVFMSRFRKIVHKFERRHVEYIARFHRAPS